MKLRQLILISAELRSLYQRLGPQYFDHAMVETIPGLYIVDFVGPLEKELQLLVDFEGNLVGINRAIYNADFTELLDYVSIP